jgi:hypothetical protein
MESKPVQLDPASAKALVDALNARPASDRNKIANAFRGGRYGAEYAEQMFRNWGATLPCEAAKESFVYDCMLAAGFKFHLIKGIYYHPKSKTAAKFLAKN